jgi:hypothetical protein
VAAVDSCIAQDADLDILVIDDGSTDASLTIARGLEPRVRVLTGQNRGVSATRNRGIAETTGEWMVFLDSDDLLLSGTLRMRIEIAEVMDADVVICDWQDLALTMNGPVDGPIRSIDRAALEEDAEIACATHVWAPPAALMYRRRIVDKIGGFRSDLPVIQDARFLFDAAYHGARFTYSPHLGARYRVGQQSLSRRDPGLFLRDVLTNGKQIEALWRARGELTSKQRDALAGIYNHASRCLFAAAKYDYFEAVDGQLWLGGQLPLHSRIVAPLARAVGLRPARQILDLFKNARRCYRQAIAYRPGEHVRPVLRRLLGTYIGRTAYERMKRAAKRALPSL